jgi:multidrug efflux pump subunit AcrB
MSVVLGALKRPWTVLVLTLALLIASLVALRDTKVDIFPQLDVPVIWVVQPYPGMSTEQIDGQFVYYYEYHFLYIAGVEHIESQSQQGLGVLKLYFHPGTDISEALAQVTAMTYRAAAFLPPGTVNPFIVRFGAGSIPAAQLVFSSATKNEAEIQDLAMNKVRPLLATLPGVSAPPPSGGKVKIVVVSADPVKMRALGVSADELAATLRSANLTLPSGNLRVGDLNALVRTDALVDKPEALADVPIRMGPGGAVRVRDVAQVGLGADVVTNVALLDGRRTVFMPVTKRADASTLEVMRTVRAAMPRMRAAVPEDVTVDLVFDQTPAVTNAISGLAVEGALGAVLTALMVLLFLRDLRAAAIVVLTIPLSLLAATLTLRALGQTINLMTLGGLALAVGILVDESTVAIENIHAHLARGAPVRRAVADAMAEVTAPRLLAMLCVLAVFLPAFFLQGIGRSLFPPLALAVGAAMVASWALSSTLVPVLAALWLRPTTAHGTAFGDAWEAITRPALAWPRVTMLLYALAVAPALSLAGALPSRLFPESDAGALTIRVRAPDGTRIERTVEVVQALDALVRELAGPDHVEHTLANIGPPQWTVPVNAQYNANMGTHEGSLLVQLTGDDRPAMRALQDAIRSEAAQRLPGVELAFEDGDVVSKVLSFGAAAEIEVVVSAGKLAEAADTARRLRSGLLGAPELVDVQIPMALGAPTVEVAFDRERLAELGTTTERAGRGLVAAAGSSTLTTPVFWVDPATGTPYRVAARVPEAKLSAESDLLGLDVGGGVSLAQVATVRPGVRPGELDRYNGRRTVSVLARSSDGDLAAAGRAVDAAIAGLGELPRGVEVTARGQVAQMRASLDGMRAGLGATVLVVLLLLTASFQSLRVALAALTVVPATLAGTVLALWLTHTGWSVQSLMGMTTAVGVAVANAVLLVTTVVDAWRAGAEPGAAVVSGGRARVRPILMTGLAMTAGMLPTALALAEGGEASAPLGRAVVGGLTGALVGTLVVLPAVLSWMRGRGAFALDLSPEEAS